MFTGLIEEKGRITKIVPDSEGLRLTVQAPTISQDTRIGDSVSVNGACLTAVTASVPLIEFQAVRETVERTNLRALRPGEYVNLERALRASDRLGGHMVQGHVDGTGTVREISRKGSQTVFRFETAAEIMKYIVGKGSITVDGISLTVASLGSDWFTVAVIPHTLASTTLGEKSSGDIVNLETDLIGKYVYKFMSKSASDSDERLMSKLSEGGFM
jgi:riboflavin synthase